MARLLCRLLLISAQRLRAMPFKLHELNGVAEKRVRDREPNQGSLSPTFVRVPLKFFPVGPTHYVKGGIVPPNRSPLGGDSCSR